MNHNKLQSIEGIHMAQQYQPIYILPQNAQRNTGKDAQRMNIAAAKIVAQTIRTTLGPKGMDKMLVDALGDVTITNDGVTILKEMNIEHPAAKMLVEIAKTQEEEVGDGTTTAVILAGELLKNAEHLLDQNIHPTIITKGFNLAKQKALHLLKTQAKQIQQDDAKTLEQIAITAMTGKGVENHKEYLATLLVEALKSINTDDIAKEDIKLETRTGAKLQDSKLIKGILLDKERVHPAMPKVLKDAKIALISSAFEIKNTETDAKITISDPHKMQEFLDIEEKMLKQMVDKLKEVGANTLICQKGIDDIAQHFLAKNGIYAVRRAKKSDMQALAKATKAVICTDIKELTQKDLGSAGLIKEELVNDEPLTVITQCTNPKAVSLLIRGATNHVIEEAKRALEDALGDLLAILRQRAITPGAGATEMHLATSLHEYAKTLTGKEQLAVQAFSQSLEIIPKTLAENAGLDPIDILAKLKSAQQSNTAMGIDVFTGKALDAYEKGIIEPLQVKTQALSSATDVATMILRVDDIIVNQQPESKGDEHMGPMQ